MYDFLTMDSFIPAMYTRPIPFF